MAQIPYTPFSTATPITGGEKIQENVPGAAFGVNVGEAIEHLGATGQQVGQELFNRAQALQELRNQTDAMRVGIDHSVEAGKLEADFKNLPDGDKLTQLPGYLDKQRQLREDYRAKLTNGQAQHFFDSDSAPFLRRIIFAASAVAGDGNKKYTTDTAKAALDVELKNGEDDPTDPNRNAVRQGKIENLAKEVARMEHGHDLPDDHPIVKEATLNAYTQFVVSRVSGIMKTDPEEALRFLNENKNKMATGAFDKMRDQIEFKSNGIITANVTDAVLQMHLKDDGTYDATPVEMQEEAKKLVRDAHPDNKALPGIVAKSIVNQLSTARYAARIDKVDTMNGLQTLVQKFNPKDVRELSAIPGADALIAKLPSQVKGDLEGYIFRWRESANKITKLDVLQRLNVLKNNDVEAFLNITDFTKAGGGYLNQQDIINLQNEQVKIAKRPEMGNDPRVNTAMGTLRGSYGTQLDDLKVFRRDPNNPKGYDSFTGMLQTALDLWPGEHNGKPPTQQDIKETIGPQVMQHYTSRWFGSFGPGHEEPVFKGFVKPMPEDVPQEFKDKAASDAREAGGANPTPHQIYQAYLKMMFNKTLQDYKTRAGK